MEILKIHAAGIAKLGEIDYEAVVKLAEGFNGADLRNVCTEAGMSAIRAERDYVIHEDFMKVSLLFVGTLFCSPVSDFSLLHLCFGFQAKGKE
ncbi:26S proteasome regulatory subunit 10B homolog A-like [Dendrobium catenatum]|uniref:26S proteasome regulatory subunit 10B homolog A-like n=1 Tax=Dendrobium catenatum TaxID=906689 RepID=UPI00109F6758|nr:26S proteasome regulatory subunit 10B homolog A-like [Dendrobium catenatum]